MRHLDLFSGIGGFSLAADRVWDCKHTFVEIDPFCQAILKKHWSQAKIHNDIKEFKGISADIVTGGFPCQPFSAAGKRRGTEDDRHLWPEMLRVIRASSPAWVIGENVGGLLTWDGGMVLDKVLDDLEAEGYEAWPLVIPACAVNAPHRRDRVWIIAHSKSDGSGRGAMEIRKEDERKSRSCRSDKRIPESREPDNSDASNANGDKLRDKSWRSGGKSRKNTAFDCGNNQRNTFPPQDVERKRSGRRHHGNPEGDDGKVQAPRSSAAFHGWKEDWLAAATRLCALDDGLPGGLVRPPGWRNAALKSAGNAIVPQVAEMIFRKIAEIENANQTI